MRAIACGRSACATCCRKRNERWWWSARCIYAGRATLSNASGGAAQPILDDE
jgi:hypothetical protein